MAETYSQEMFRKGLEALHEGRVYLAMKCLEKAKFMREEPLYCSSLAFCLAKTKKSYRQALNLCREAVAKESWNTTHYFYMGRVYLLSGDRKMAIKAFQDGLLQREDRVLRQELGRLGVRKPPLFPSYDRSHPLNRYGGLVMSKLGLR